jgi:putative spermidine/putrescine transport system ATP-binding protein
VAGRGVQGARNGETRRLALRPETVEIGEGGEGRNRLRGKIELVSFLGSIVRIRVRIGENLITLDTFNTAAAKPPQVGETIALNFGRDDLLLLDDSAMAAA